MLYIHLFVLFCTSVDGEICQYLKKKCDTNINLMTRSLDSLSLSLKSTGCCILKYIFFCMIWKNSIQSLIFFLSEKIVCILNHAIMKSKYLTLQQNRQVIIVLPGIHLPKRIQTKQFIPYFKMNTMNQCATSKLEVTTP